jgi:threonine synthase
VATSGDTGGAVASGFQALRSRSNHSLSIRKVSNIQEKQLTTLGQNIKALEVDGVLMIVRTW